MVAGDAYAVLKSDQPRAVDEWRVEVCEHAAGEWRNPGVWESSNGEGSRRC